VAEHILFYQQTGSCCKATTVLCNTCCVVMRIQQRNIAALTANRELQTRARYWCTCRQQVFFTDSSGIFLVPLASDSTVICRQQRDGYCCAYWQQGAADNSQVLLYLQAAGVIHWQQWDISGSIGKWQCCDMQTAAVRILLHLWQQVSSMMRRQQRRVSAYAGKKQQSCDEHHYYLSWTKM